MICKFCKFCKFEGCGKKLNKKNYSGFCHLHFHYSQRKNWPKKPCKICGRKKVGHWSKSDLCLSCRKSLKGWNARKHYLDWAKINKPKVYEKIMRCSVENKDLT